jgi:ADP-dependent NAD(P)H-hydrate dehydratase / NAD(P)H-hydrate epimerase
MIFEPLYTAEEMRAAEAGHDVEAMMARAGAGVALEALRAFPDAVSWTVVCGGGANGGDGRIAADALRDAGREVLVVDAKAGETELGSPEAIVDALFGTGFAGEPRPDAAALIERMNDAGAPVVAVDVPSGVDASTGEVAGAAVRAALTVTMHAPKVGLVVAPGRFHTGEVVSVDIGLAAGETRHRLVTREVLALVPRKSAGDNKYSAGSVLVVGGSHGMTGAATLAARAAFRADAGYVAICAEAGSLPVLETLVVEAVKRPLEDVDAAVERASALAIGPGLGRTHGDLVTRLLESDRPAVVDADGLHELAPFRRDAPTVLTPHSGELARLLGYESSRVDTHRLAALAEAVERYGCVVLLKGADTLVGAPGEGVLVCSHDVPGLATAGTGDVLTGVAAAFLAKRMDARVAAAAAATAHAAAAELGPERGLVATDVVEALPDALDAV